MSGFSIARMRPEHMGGVMEIEMRSFGEPWSGESFSKEMENQASDILVALEGGRVAGYVCASSVLDEGHMLKLAVRPELRGRGLGRALADAAVERLRRRGCLRVLLEVRAGNEAAIRIYRSIGFGILGIRKAYYNLPPKDAAVMELKL